MMGRSALPNLIVGSVMASIIERGIEEGVFKVTAASLEEIKAKARAALIERAVRMLSERDLQHLRRLAEDSLNALRAKDDAIKAMSCCERCLEAVARTRAIYRQLHAEIYP